MKYILIILLSLVFVGCQINTLPLEDKWRPLKLVVERGEAPEGLQSYINNGVTTTIGRNIYVANIKKWEKRYPKGSHDRGDLLSHEIVHSSRQIKMGIIPWLRLYATDLNFRLYEEQLGYYVDIRRKVNRDWKVNAHSYADGMARVYHGMITYKEALKWVNDVISGRWKPKAGDLPNHPEMPK
jgi:hypothetical protein